MIKELGLEQEADAIIQYLILKKHYKFLEVGIT